MIDTEHKNLEAACDAFVSSGSQDAYQKILEEINLCIQNNDSFVINAVPILGKPGQADPAGIDGPDGKMYLILFTTNKKSAEAENPHPMMAGIRDLIKSSFINRQVGGFCFDYKIGKKVPLVSKSILIRMWDDAVKREAEDRK